LSSAEENKEYVNATYLKKIAQDFKQIKNRSYELLQLQANSQVLDIGCGPATDTIPMAAYIGEEGRVIGIDSDPKMLEQASQEVKQQNITKNVLHIEGNADKLPFADGEFDRVHAERLFQVLPQSKAKQVFAEMNRVLRSGGRIVLVDTDWASASVNFSDLELERRLVYFFASKLRPNGFSGRELLTMLVESNFYEITVDAMPFMSRDFSGTPFSEWLTREALKNAAATQLELYRWNRELTDKSLNGSFLFHVNMILVSGRKR
jgi:ubiquinone/menaquinone biosynthesis C-methylase UbiE